MNTCEAISLKECLNSTWQAGLISKIGISVAGQQCPHRVLKTLPQQHKGFYFNNNINIHTFLKDLNDFSLLQFDLTCIQLARNLIPTVTSTIGLLALSSKVSCIGWEIILDFWVMNTFLCLCAMKIYWNSNNCKY